MGSLAAQPAQNTLLRRGNGQSPQTFLTVANVSSINGFNMSAKVDDVTSHSTGVPWRQKIPTLLDVGDVTFTLFFLPGDAGHRKLLYDFVNRITRDWVIQFPDNAASVWQAAGFLSKFGLKAPVDGVISADMTLTLTGDPIMDVS